MITNPVSGTPIASFDCEWIAEHADREAENIRGILDKYVAGELTEYQTRGAINHCVRRIGFLARQTEHLERLLHPPEATR
jgi:hypothetical protein